jgi:uncharacterized small protein (DUF1192 family)
MFRSNRTIAPGINLEADMDRDEQQATPRRDSHVVGEPIETLSKDELEQRLKSLSGEIDRLKAELERKKAHEAAAAELFTGKG